MEQEYFSDAAFGRRLREVRKAAGMTQDDLATAMAATGHGMHRSTIAKIESGERPSSLNEAVHFAKLLGVDLEDLVVLLTDKGRELISVSIRAKLKVHLLRRELEVTEDKLQAALAHRDQVTERLNKAEAELAVIAPHKKAADRFMLGEELP